MLTPLENKYRYSFILLRQLVITDFKLRYQGSVLGYFWSLLKPLMMFAILYVVFVEFLKLGRDIANFPIYLLLGIVLWNFFAEITNTSVTAVVSKGDLIRKLNFPKYVIVLSGALSALINLALNFVVIVIFMLLTGVQPSEHFWLLPLLILQLFILSLALAFFLSAAFVRLRDINYVWEVFMQAFFYATPILYPLQMVPHEVGKFLVLNPVGQIIQDLRYVLVTDESHTIASYWPWYMWSVPIGITLGLALLSGLYFKKRSKYFAEEV